MMQEEMRDYALDFGGAFFCIALSKGANQVVHVDKMDWPKGYAIVIPLGDFEGGDIILPTLDYAIPLKPGQILGFLAAFIPHYCTALEAVKPRTQEKKMQKTVRPEVAREPERYVATLFTDRDLAMKTRNLLLEMQVSVTDLNFDLNTSWLR
jgi:hypothetical protein